MKNWRPNNEYEADIAMEALLAGDLKVSDVLLGDKTSGSGLASVWLYQLCYLTNYREGKPLAGIKEQLDCARWRIPSG